MMMCVFGVQYLFIFYDAIIKVWELSFESSGSFGICLMGVSAKNIYKNMFYYAK